MNCFKKSIKRLKVDYEKQNNNLNKNSIFEDIMIFEGIQFLSRSSNKDSFIP